MAEVRLRLSQPAPAGLMVELELEEEGFGDLVGFPAMVEFAEGSKVAVVEIEVGSQTGEAEIRATLPESLGGESDDLKIKVKDRMGKDDEVEEKNEDDEDDDS